MLWSVARRHGALLAADVRRYQGVGVDNTDFITTFV